jgi:KDO2-lipid IV(A) lauroyltransferase
MAQRDAATMQDIWVDRALGGFLGASARLPYASRIALGGFIGRRVLARPAGYRRRILDNLDYVLPDRSPAERRAIAGEAADNAGRILMEHFSLGELGDRMARAAPEGPGVAALEEARDAGRPIAMMTSHLGNHEAGWVCLIRHGLPLGVLYRPLSNALVNARYEAMADAHGYGPRFPQSRAGLGQLLRHMRAGGAAMMLNDIYSGSGVPLDFLGRPAMTSLSTAELALKLDALVLPFFAIRQPDGVSFRVEIEEPVAEDDPVALTQAVNARVEARILAHPGQWLWMHRRWKRKWNRGAGDAPDLHPAARPRRQSR